MNKGLVFISILLCLTGLTFADSNGVWIKAEDIRGGTFASDEGNGQFTFGAVPKLPLTASGSCTILSVDATGTITCTTEQDTLSTVATRGNTFTGTLNVNQILDSKNTIYGISPSTTSVFNYLWTNTFNTSGSTYLASNSGKVGIGTGTPSQKLEVIGTTKTTDLILDGTGKNCAGKLITDGTGKVSCGVDNVNDADADPANELPLAGTGILVSAVDKRTVSVDTNTIQNKISGTCPYGISSITSTGVVNCLSAPIADGDGDSTNEIQTLSISNEKISLSKGGGIITLPIPITHQKYIVGPGDGAPLKLNANSGNAFCKSKGYTSYTDFTTKTAVGGTSWSCTYSADGINLATAGFSSAQCGTPAGTPVFNTLHCTRTDNSQGLVIDDP